MESQQKGSQTVTDKSPKKSREEPPPSIVITAVKPEC
jgi:hypothetical protein